MGKTAPSAEPQEVALSSPPESSDWSKDAEWNSDQLEKETSKMTITKKGFTVVKVGLMSWFRWEFLSRFISLLRRSFIYCV
jgi:hypothetical protein